MANFEILSGLTFVDRKGWGASTNHPRLGHRIARNERTHVIVHHTVMPDTDNTPNLWESENGVFEMMRKLQNVRPELGHDVPYNFVAFLMNTNVPSMYICEGRGEDRTGAHTKGHNRRGIAIAFAGNFHDLDVEFHSYVHLLSYFLGWLKFNPNHPSYGGPFEPMSNLGSFRPNDRNVFAHKDFKNTNCPGRLIVPFLKNIDFIDPN